MGHFKDQAKRLRDRLKASGIDIPMALSLETVAAVHNKPHWDALAPLDKGMSEDVAQPVRRAIDEIPFDLNGRPGASPASRPVHILVDGTMGAGKTTLAMLLADHFSGRGCKPIVPLLFHTSDGNSHPENAALAIKRLADLPISPCAIIVVDDLEVADEATVGRILALLHAAVAAGHSLIMTTQDASELNRQMALAAGETQMNWPAFRGIGFFLQSTLSPKVDLDHSAVCLPLPRRNSARRGRPRKPRPSMLPGDGALPSS